MELGGTINEKGDNFQAYSNAVTNRRKHRHDRCLPENQQRLKDSPL